jgi:predicted secreted protein
MVVSYPELPPVLELPPYLSEEAVTELAAAIVACANVDGGLNSPVAYNLADNDGNGIPDMFQATIDCLFIALPDWSAKYGVSELADKDSNGRADIAEQSAMDAAAFTVQLMKDLGLLGCEDLDGDGLPDCIRPYMVDAGTVTPMDPNGDGIPDWACDDNGDGIPNIEDTTYESLGDLDRDGVPDMYDADLDGDGVPNYCDADPKNPLNSEVVVPPSGESSGSTTDDLTNLVLTEADNGTSGSVALNGKFVLSLPSYADGGYEWSITDIDAKILQNLAHTHDLSRCPDGVAGCSGNEVFTFKALEVGMSQLSLESRRGWEPATAEPAATFTLTIHVLPDGAVTVVGDSGSASGTGW